MENAFSLSVCVWQHEQGGEHINSRDANTIADIIRHRLGQLSPRLHSTTRVTFFPAEILTKAEETLNKTFCVLFCRMSSNEGGYCGKYDSSDWSERDAGGSDWFREWINTERGLQLEHTLTAAAVVLNEMNTLPSFYLLLFCLRCLYLLYEVKLWDTGILFMLPQNS